MVIELVVGAWEQEQPMAREQQHTHTGGASVGLVGAQQGKEGKGQVARSSAQQAPGATHTPLLQHSSTYTVRSSFHQRPQKPSRTTVCPPTQSVQQQHQRRGVGQGPSLLVVKVHLGVARDRGAQGTGGVGRRTARETPSCCDRCACGRE